MIVPWGGCTANLVSEKRRYDPEIKQKEMFLFWMEIYIFIQLLIVASFKHHMWNQQAGSIKISLFFSFICVIFCYIFLHSAIYNL